MVMSNRLLRDAIGLQVIEERVEPVVVLKPDGEVAAWIC